MATITFTADNGATQEFDLGVLATTATVTEVDVKESDGTEETFVPETEAVAPTE